MFEGTLEEYSRLQKVGIWAMEDLCWFPSFSCFGVGGQSYSNFLASTVLPNQLNLPGALACRAPPGKTTLKQPLAQGPFLVNQDTLSKATWRSGYSKLAPELQLYPTHKALK